MSWKFMTRKSTAPYDRPRLAGGGKSVVYLLAAMMGMTTLVSGCQPVPLSGRPLQKKEQRPVKPLFDQPVTGTIHDGRKPKSGFKLVDTSAKSQKAAAKAKAKSGKPGQSADVSQQLADASDKAASAQSLAQSARTKDDWNLVFTQWKRAIKILKRAPSQTPTVKKKLAEYNRGLVQATRDAEVSLNPSLAPVDPTGSRAIRTLINVQENPKKEDAKAKAADSKTGGKGDAKKAPADSGTANNKADSPSATPEATKPAPDDANP